MPLVQFRPDDLLNDNSYKKLKLLLDQVPQKEQFWIICLDSLKKSATNDVHVLFGHIL